MSPYRDSLDAETRDSYGDAISAAARVLAPAYRDQDMLAAADGTQAVAEAAYYPQHRLGSAAAIKDRYEQFQEEARRRQRAA